jgi:hypothetical protein
VIITGSITPFGDSVRVAIKALRTDTARVLAADTIDLARTKTIAELSERKRNEVDASGPDATSTSVPQKRSYHNSFITIDLEALGVSENKDSISLALRNTLASESLYLAANTNYHTWLVLVDNNGEKWTTKHVTELPHYAGSRNYVQIGPGQDISVSATFTPAKPLTQLPQSISLTGELFRRSVAEQQRIDKGGYASVDDPVTPFVIGIANIPLR